MNYFDTWISNGNTDISNAAKNLHDIRDQYCGNNISLIEYDQLCDNVLNDLKTVAGICSYLEEQQDIMNAISALKTIVDAVK
jgi:hypothetical protein